ncbi:helix-hairpin-helix domain-containing protein [Haloparvum sedimenti]|uniref:helix-hairpin-helix domain-containing protein n=1 Tax=Haloparvum sedimenti TaxID=1678448 RepID=UPI00071E8DED|nr:helix-hairpin-helix domain-containing protein [Haloparvum sedimenti]
MDEPTRLVRDATNRYKLKVSLPGGRYQLSLDDRGVILLTDELGYSERETVPDPIVPALVAMGDAWFPRERDVDAILSDLPANGHLSPAESEAVRSYLTTSYVQERNVSRVLDVADRPPVGSITEDDLTVQSLPSLPDGIASDDDGAETGRAGPAGAASDATSETETPPERPEEEESAGSPERDGAANRFEEIPGIGPDRSARLAAADVSSLSELAELRPTDLAATSDLSEGVAAVAIEGARELIGQVPPTEERLAAQTGVSAAEFDSALAPLAAAGVPPSEAAPTLRAIFGPTVGDIETVSGVQAYFLWEAGYRTPKDIADASLEELEAIYQVGSATAPRIRDAATELIGE